MKIASLDISRRKIGIVIYDLEEQITIFETVVKRNFRESIEKIYSSFRPNHTIIGLSTHKDGTLTTNGQYVKSFCHAIRDTIKPFEYVDEYLTTFEASTFKKENELIDKVAARMILGRYLEKKEFENKTNK